MEANREGYLSLREVAHYSSLSITTLRSYLEHPMHPLPHFKMPGKILIKRDDFDAWIQQYRCSKPPLDLDRLVNEVLADL